MVALPRPTSLLPRAASVKRRLVPLFIAGLVCFLVASAAGYSLWYFTDYRASARRSQHSQEAGVPAKAPGQLDATAPAFDTSAFPATSSPAPAIVAAAEPTPAPTPQFISAPAGEAIVPGGEVALGGEGTNTPLRRVLVDQFAIGETEVTNAEYAEFVSETERKAPDEWTNNGEYPVGTELLPVTNVTWQDAVDYCAWLSKKINANVRLPTEAEWELAARGADRLRYPWGNEWNDEAAASAETNGEVRSVKSYEKGRSPYGAYDMAGNVWEWISDPAMNQHNRPRVINGIPLALAKGGAANESKSVISATARQEVLANGKFKTLGFRYVVLRSNHTAHESVSSETRTTAPAAN